MHVNLTHLPPEHGFPGDIEARAGDGLHFVSVRVRFPPDEGTAKTLRILARAVLEVIVAAKEYRR